MRKDLHRRPERRLPPRPVIGLEAEFTLLLDGQPERPEKVFGSPARLIRRRMLPRTGRSFQLPSGGAIYFDTGVIEVATPIVELERGCCYRATRLLWEQIRYLHRELKAWAAKNKCRAQLQGFSTHYNFSFSASDLDRERTPTSLAELLGYIVLLPAILVAANRRSTAAGIRPRGDRLEVTCDFNPDAALMLANCALLAGVVDTVSHWPKFRLENLSRNHLPRLKTYLLRKHSSRKGKRLLADSLARNPFTSDPNEKCLLLTDGRKLSLRQFSSEIFHPFRVHTRRLSDPGTLHHLDAIFAGDARSLLDFSDRPADYDDVGRTITWNRRRVRRHARSTYERVIHRVITREPIHVGGKRYVARQMRGWYEIVFREMRTGRRRVFNLDELVEKSL